MLFVRAILLRKIQQELPMTPQTQLDELHIGQGTWKVHVEIAPFPQSIFLMTPSLCNLAISLLLRVAVPAAGAEIDPQKPPVDFLASQLSEG